MRGIKEKQTTDNVVELMAGKITGLSENSQEILKLGTCMGSFFDPGLLATIFGKTGKDILPALKEALQEGMLCRIDDILWIQP